MPAWLGAPRLCLGCCALLALVLVLLGFAAALLQSFLISQEQNKISILPSKFKTNGNHLGWIQQSWFIMMYSFPTQMKQSPTTSQLLMTWGMSASTADIQKEKEKSA